MSRPTDDCKRCFLGDCCTLSCHCRWRLVLDFHLQYLVPVRLEHCWAASHPNVVAMAETIGR